MHYDKNFNELTKNEIIAIHLDSSRAFTKDFVIESTLRVILREARHCLNYENSKHIMPSLGAFASLDQIGNTYTRSDLVVYGSANANGIKKALYYFGGFGENDDATKSLYAFRNALVHNASLLNERNGVYHSFRYDSTAPSPVVPAAQQWNGDIANLDDTTTTLINPVRLVDLVTAMVDTLNDCLSAGTLQTTLSESDIAGNYLLLAKK